MSISLPMQIIKNMFLMISAMILTLFVCMGFDLMNGLRFTGDYHIYFWSDVVQYIGSF